MTSKSLKSVFIHFFIPSVYKIFFLDTFSFILHVKLWVIIPKENIQIKVHGTDSRVIFDYFFTFLTWLWKCIGIIYVDRAMDVSLLRM